MARRGGAQLGPVFAGHGWLQGGLAIRVKYGKVLGVSEIWQ